MGMERMKANRSKLMKLAKQYKKDFLDVYAMWFEVDGDFKALTFLLRKELLVEVMK